MGFFGSTDTVNGKARAVLGDLPEDPSPFEILQSVDQKAGENVDPDDVVQQMRGLDDTVDTKLAAVDGTTVDQKAMRDAAGTLATAAGMPEDEAMDVLSALVNGDVDQAALTRGADDTNMTPDADTSDDSGTNPDGAGDGDVDQKQENEGGDGGEGGESGPLGMLNDDARETVEEFADLAGKDPEECVEEVLGVGGGGGDGGAEPTEPEPGADTAGEPDMNAGGSHDEEPGYDQKLEDLDINERVAEAVTSDEVLDEMAGAVAQKMADDDSLADQLVETVDQKGDFATTDEAVVTAPGTESKTVGEAGAVTGGDDE